jgi:hypothetical protein
MIVTLERASNRLRDGFDELKADAEADGHRHLTRLAAEFEKTPACSTQSLRATLQAILRGSAPLPTSPL